MNRYVIVLCALLLFVSLSVVSRAQLILRISPDGNAGELTTDFSTLTTATDILEGITVTMEP
ncbi:MAG: hypothetical protein JW885_09695 [Deltaproteobacteria bacterium]|nr:hypothetical protein [Candidatus Zymogenaceae bacterium]